MSEQPPAAADAVMEIGGGRRLTSADDALSVEVRGGGAWSRARVVPYEDIRAVYRYETTDWAAVGLLSGLWLLALLAILIAAGIGGWSPTVTLAATGLSTLLVAAVGVLRARSAPARKLKIEAYSGVLVVPDRSSRFFAQLAARLSEVRARAAVPPAPPAQPGVSPANSEPGSPPEQELTSP